MSRQICNALCGGNYKADCINHTYLKVEMNSSVGIGVN